MKKLIFLVALVLLLASPMRAKTQWTVGSKVFDVDTLVFPHMVGPGVIFAKYDLPAMPLKVSVMEMDLTNKYVDFETCKGGDKGVAEENPLSMATRNNRPGHEVIGATNGDFYFFQNTLENGIPRSGQFKLDQCITNPVGRACFVLDDERRPYIDRVDFYGSITHKGESYRLHTVNMQRLEWENTGGNQINLYTNAYGPKTENCAGGMKALIRPKSGAFAWHANAVENCVVDSIFDGNGVSDIPEGCAILWARGTCIDRLKAMAKGDELAINLKVDLRSQPGLLKNFKELMGGSDHIILQNGNIIDDWDERHPRTCIGFNADSTKVYFVVIDGRSPKSTGVSLGEAAGVFLGLGAVNAVNLDGGGSSCMVVNGDVVNTPSDGSLRSVGNGCLLVSNAPVDDEIGLINFAPRCWNISISAKIAPKVWGYNKYGVLKIRELEDVTLSCDPQVGTFRDGTFIASATPADGNIYAEYKGVKCAQPVRIVNAEKKLRDKSVVVDKNHDYEIKVLGVSGAGSDIVDPSVMNWTSSNTDVAAVDEFGVVKAVADGEAEISGKGENFEGTVSVKVQNPKAHVTTVEQVSIDPTTWTITQSGGKNRTITSFENGMKIDFVGASSRNPYIKLAKKMALWGIPDTLRVRFRPGNLKVKRVSISTNTVNGAQVISDFEIPENVEGEYVCKLPTSQWCDAADLSNYPLQMVYIYFSTGVATTGQNYSLEIHGIELLYGKDEASGVTTVVADNNRMTVTPNPAYAGAMVTVAGAKEDVKIYNIEGRLVKTETPIDGKISTSGLSAGVYLLQSGAQTARMIIK